MKIQSAEVIASVAGTGFAVTVAAATPEHVLLAFCGMGAAFGGIIAMNLADEKHGGKLCGRQRAWRWMANFCAGCSLGPFVADHAGRNWFSEMPVIYVALAAGALCGACGMGAFCVVGPELAKWIKEKFTRR